MGTDNKLSLVKEETEQGLALASQEASKGLADSKNAVTQEIIKTGEIQVLSDKLNVADPNTIVTFGKDAATDLSKTADNVLGKYDMSMINQSSRMMSTLGSIMDKVDIEELKDGDVENKGVLAKLFNSTQRKLDSFVKKYNTIGNEIEKVCIELRTFESQITTSNDDLKDMYDNAISNYKVLVKYIAAGDLAMQEVDKYITGLNAQIESGDSSKQMELQAVSQAKQLLDQRLMDLRAAESIALQSIPIIKSMQFGNLNLIRKINSSFIVTIPVFKNAVAQAVIMKQQAIQAKALSELDKRTNEMILKNAQNASNQMKLTTELAGSSAIKTDTIEQSWQIIMDGIRDTKAIQQQLEAQREADKNRLMSLNNSYLEEIGGHIR